MIDTTQATSRAHQGFQIPLPGTYAIDKVHSSVEFVARHMMIARVRGRFVEFDGSVQIAEAPEDSAVEVSIRAGSVLTNDEGRDNHLRSPDFLDAERFPTLHFKSTAVELTGDGDWKVHGDLTIRDVTRRVVLDLELEGVGPSPWGDMRAGFHAETEINREDFGLTWNAAIETGGVVVGPKVKIELNVEAVRQA